jgi:hypothetical protein
MMIFLSLSDGLQLIIHMFSGILVIGNYKIDPTINMVGCFLSRKFESFPKWRELSQKAA